MKVSSQSNYNPSFNAIQLSQWRCSNAKNTAKNISIVSIEKNDLDFMQKFLTYIEKQKNDNISAKEIMVYSTKTIIDILSSNLPKMDKIKMFVATYNNLPCGLFVANIPKSYANDETYVYSSRHNSRKSETEIDWLVTWNPTGNEKLKGVGKALVGEYFHTIKKDKFRDVFVRSEVPEKSFAAYFYENLGFERLSTRRLKLSNKNSAQYIVKDYGCESNDDTIPMLITRRKLLEKANELAQEMNRQEFKKKSIDAENLISIN